MQLPSSAAGIGRVQLAVNHACGGKATSTDVGSPFHGEVRHVCGREDCLVRIDSVMRWVEAEMCPISSGNRPRRGDRRAKQYVCPDLTADRERPGQTVFFDDCAAAIVGHCFTNKANNIHSSWFSF